jgi:hypothetical protein
MKLRGSMASFRNVLNNFKHYYLSHQMKSDSSNVAKYLKHVDEFGYCSIARYYDEDQCNSLIIEIDDLFKQYEENLWIGDFGADKRLFGIEAISKKIKKYYDDEMINLFFELYEKNTNKSGFVMAGHLQYKTDNLGSGQGWHRDRLDFKQTKSIIYLSDVSIKNGPFQYIEKSHKPHHLIHDSLSYGKELLRNRISSDHVDSLISTTPNRLKTFNAKAGTLILVDVRGIHRGMPIVEGDRYAMTNYTWFDMQVPSHIEKILIK